MAQWLFVNGLLLAIYFIWDLFIAYPKEEIVDITRDETQVRKLTFSGLWPNVPLLIGVVLGVALLAPGKPILGWNPWMYAREIVQIALVALSLLLGSEAVRRANNFNYHAIVEVAALFFGIFICMQAPLQILNARGSELGLTTPMHFFWATGSLSSVLDNAPTYVVFFETARALTAGTPALANGTVIPSGTGVAESLLIAISLGAVFMGAMTYIGNGPNFMVKAIAEKSGIKMPSFFGYMLYSFLNPVTGTYPHDVDIQVAGRFEDNRLTGGGRLSDAARFRGCLSRPSPPTPQHPSVQGARERVSSGFRRSHSPPFGCCYVSHLTITSQSDLLGYCDQLSKADWIAMDTEFVSEDSYRPELCLIQVAGPEGMAIIDTLAIPDVTPFWKVLAEGNHETIVHAGRGDIEFCLRVCRNTSEEAVRHTGRRGLRGNRVSDRTS